MLFWNLFGKHRSLKNIVIFHNFISLTKKHDGRYLASVTADCLEHFGLAKHVSKFKDNLILESDFIIATWHMYG